MEKKTPAWGKLKEKTIGAFRHVLEKHMANGFMVVGFSAIFYCADKEPGKRWFYDSRNIIDTHNIPDLHSKKISERINLVNEFLAEGCKRILEGEIDDLMASKEDIEGFAFQIPGVKGKV